MLLHVIYLNISLLSYTKITANISGEMKVLTLKRKRIQWEIARWLEIFRNSVRIILQTFGTTGSVLGEQKTRRTQKSEKKDERTIVRVSVGNSKINSQASE